MIPKRARQSAKTAEENEDEMASRLHLDIGEGPTLVITSTCTAD
jgi:hypothetical protein